MYVYIYIYIYIYIGSSIMPWTDEESERHWCGRTRRDRSNPKGAGCSSACPSDIGGFKPGFRVLGLGV